MVFCGNDDAHDLGPLTCLATGSAGLYRFSLVLILRPFFTQKCTHDHEPRPLLQALWQSVCRRLWNTVNVLNGTGKCLAPGRFCVL